MRTPLSFIPKIKADANLSYINLMKDEGVYIYAFEINKRDIRKIEESREYIAVFELLTNGMHHHLVCQQCGHVETIDHEIVSQFFSSLEIKTLFQVSTNHLILFGKCVNCCRSEKSGV